MADVASKLFATTIHATDVVIETLERRTDPMQSAETVKPRLAAAIAVGHRRTTRRTPRWRPTRWRSGPRPRSASNRRPTTVPGCARRRRSLSDAAEAAGAGFRRRRRALPEGAEDACFSSRAAPSSSAPAGEATSRSSACGCTSSSPARAAPTRRSSPYGVRKVVLDGQEFLPEGDGDKRLYALHFCHNCGQEHLPVWYCDDGGAKRLEARPIEDFPLEEDDDGKTALRLLHADAARADRVQRRRCRLSRDLDRARQERRHPSRIRPTAS